VRLSSQGILVSGSSAGDVDFKTVGPLSSHEPISAVIGKIRRRHHLRPNGKQGGLENGLPGSEKDRSTKPLSSRESREHALSLGTLDSPLTDEEALTLLTVNRVRCKEGYLFDEARNKKILADDVYLQDFWDWVERR
jgi:hypothetical protein